MSHVYLFQWLGETTTHFFIFEDKRTSREQIDYIRSLLSTNLPLYNSSQGDLIYWQRMNTTHEELEALDLAGRLKKLPLEELKRLHTTTTRLFKLYQINGLLTKVDIISKLMPMPHSERIRTINLAMRLLPLFNLESERSPAEYNVHTVVLSLCDLMKLPDTIKEPAIHLLEGLTSNQLDASMDMDIFQGMDAHSKRAYKIHMLCTSIHSSSPLFKILDPENKTLEGSKSL